MNLLTTTFSTPVGPFSCALDASGAVVATAFGELATLRSRLPAGCQLMDDKQGAPSVRLQVTEYFAGKRRQFDLRLGAGGTPFQQRVWAALTAIPFGETRSYREIAISLSRPKAARAVGRANATNPICLIVPCHRVIGVDGSLTGFAFGEDIKRRLLDHEQSASARTRAA
jgi:methylated-DNA-[protein]-cysteine S-methyltransferase